MSFQYVVTCSGGNDSVALIQYMQENHKGEFVVLYNDTGWAYKEWPARIAMIANMCFEKGIMFHTTKSEGMEALVKRKKGWPKPASNMQFCTQELKERPSLLFYEKNDPTILKLTVDDSSWETEAHPDQMFAFNSKANKRDKETGELVHKTKLEVLDGAELIVVTGRRREESQNRRDLGKWQFNSAKHGGRDVYNPLIMFDESKRNEYIVRFGLEPLPHSSRECFCVCKNKEDLSKEPLNSPWIDRIEKIEIDMGHTKNGKPRVMFRPYRCGGAVGIRQVFQWGHGKRGWKADHVPEIYQLKGEGTEGFGDQFYDNTKEGLEFARQCEGGFCGN